MRYFVIEILLRIISLIADAIQISDFFLDN